MLLPRLAENNIEAALLDTRVVAVQGARQTGKSTLVKMIAVERNGLYVTLDDSTQRQAALNDVASFVRQAQGGMMVIDEVQRVPGLALAIKEVVDIDTRPGQFLLTGSSDLSNGNAIEDSLAGRIEIVDLYGLGMTERLQTDSSFLEALFSDDPLTYFGGKEYPTTRQEYLELAVAGSYPEAIVRSEKSRRDKWFDNYARQLLRKDVAEGFNLRRVEILSKLLRYLASISGKPAVTANIANDLQEPRTTLENYIALLAAVFLVDHIPGWSTNATTRATKHHKLMFRDSGLLARQLNVAGNIFSDLTSSYAGLVFEAFAYGELQKTASAKPDAYSIHHYRDTLKREVDFVVTDANGRASLLEVKLSTTAGTSDFKAIKELQKAEKSIVNGIVLYSGNKAVAFGDHLFAVPLQAIWS